MQNHKGVLVVSWWCHGCVMVVSWLCHGCVVLAAADMERVYYHIQVATVPHQYIYAHVQYTIHIHNCSSRLRHCIIIVEMWHKYYAVTGHGRFKSAFKNMYVI